MSWYVCFMANSGGCRSKSSSRPRVTPHAGVAPAVLAALTLCVAPAPVRAWTPALDAAGPPQPPLLKPGYHGKYPDSFPGPASHPAYSDRVRTSPAPPGRRESYRDRWHWPPAPGRGAVGARPTPVPTGTPGAESISLDAPPPAEYRQLQQRVREATEPIIREQEALRREP
jgi:hypothetical protein